MVVLGVDIGGTKLAAAAVLASGELRYKQRVATPKDPKKFLHELVRVCQMILKQQRCTRIAISLPGYTHNGTIVFAGRTLRGLVDMNLQRELTERLGLPVSVYNDADCFAVAEHVAGPKSELTLGVIWGSGVGFGLVTGKKGDLRFPVGSRIELGHQPFGEMSIEQAAGGVAVEQQYFHMTGETRSVQQLWRRRKTDVLAKQFTDRMLDAMIRALTTATLAFAPDRIVLGGGVSKLPVITRLQKGVAKRLPPGIALPAIERFRVADDAGLLGATFLS